MGRGRGHRMATEGEGLCSLAAESEPSCQTQSCTQGQVVHLGALQALGLISLALLPAPNSPGVGAQGLSRALSLTAGICPPLPGHWGLSCSKEELPRGPGAVSRPRAARGQSLHVCSVPQGQAAPPHLASGHPRSWRQAGQP